MKIEEHIIRKHLHEMVSDQLKEEYLKEGWKVSIGEKLGKHTADLIARKGKKTLVFEIKTSNYSEKDKKHVERLRHEAVEKGYEFRLVIANPPKERSIEIIGLDQLFLAYFIKNETPDELNGLSSATVIEDVYDIEIDELTINEGKNIEAKGKGTISVTLQYGPSSDRGSVGDSYPFSFSIILVIDENKLRISETQELSVDTSSFYE